MTEHGHRRKKQNLIKRPNRDSQRTVSGCSARHAPADASGQRRRSARSDHMKIPICNDFYSLIATPFGIFQTGDKRPDLRHFIYT
eukprot:m.59705 g.59705  ORF g.59705 m.59705 type:complete len:85 (-) comp15714_c1_seq5:163-417(-)